MNAGRVSRPVNAHLQFETMATHDRNLNRADTLRTDIECRTGSKTSLETRSTTCCQASMHFAMPSNECVPPTHSFSIGLPHWPWGRMRRNEGWTPDAGGDARGPGAAACSCVQLDTPSSTFENAIDRTSHKESNNALHAALHHATKTPVSATSVFVLTDMRIGSFSLDWNELRQNP